MRGGEPLIAFTVAGIPKSSAKGRRKTKRNLRLWMETVQAAAREAAIGSPLPTNGRFSVRITYYYWESTDLDVDNIAKPILDALTGVVYYDDSQVDELSLRKTDHAGELDILNAPPELAGILHREKHFIHIRCYGPPNHEELV